MQYQSLDNSDQKDAHHIQSKELINSGGSYSQENPPAPFEQNVETPEARRKKFIKWGIIGGIALIVIVLAIVLPLTLIHRGGGGDDNNDHKPLPVGNMNPYIAVGSQSVAQSGASISGRLALGSLTTPAQRFMQAVPQQFLQYLEEKTEADEKKQIGVDWRNMNFFGANNMIETQLTYQLDLVTTNIGRMVIAQGNASRFSIPSDLVENRTGDPSNRLEMMGFRVPDPATSKKSFGFELVDVNDPTNVLLSTLDQTLLFSDKYIQMDFILPSQYVYGLGDRVHEFRLAEGAYSMWASGQDHSPYDDGQGRGGLSGVHPFVLVQTKNPRRYIGLFFRNSNAMTPVLRYNDDGTTSTLSFITIGGQLEVFIIGQGTAHEVIQSYQQMIDLPRLVPFWALGWQEASPERPEQGTDQDSVAQSSATYMQKGFPVDAFYLAANSWDQTVDFQLDKSKFPSISSLTKTLHDRKQKLVAYIDSGVNVQNRAQNPVYQAGKAANAFIKSAINAQNPDGYLVNVKQKKPVVYVDWLNQQCVNFWQAQVKSYLQNVQFDGLWTIMNEPYADSPGEIAASKLTEEHLLQVAEKIEVVSEPEPAKYNQSWFYSYWPLNQLSTYFLPFIPGAKEQGNYDTMTLSLNATHSNSYTEYDVHSLYAHGMMAATVNALLDSNDNRPFVLTKGSFASTGKYTATVAHTLQTRTWSQLYYGLQSTLRSQMFGMPHSGADVCGFYPDESGQLDEELCLRWYQMATFFPLARHKQQAKGPRTEPFNFKDQTYMAQVKKTMHDRMQYLRLMYTCMFETSDSGGTCMDPIHFRYQVPNVQMLSTLEFTSSYLFAGSIKVSPIVNSTKSMSTFRSYFPKGNWVNLADWSEVISANDDIQTLTIRDTVNAHLAPGALIPWQNNTDMSVMTTDDLFQKPISLVANRDQNGAAGGSLFLDTGYTRSEMDTGNYEYYSMNLQVNSIQFQGARSNKGTQNHTLDQIFILNATDLSEGTFACYYRPDSLEPQPLLTTYMAEKKAFVIKTVGVTKFSDIMNIYYGSSNNGDLNLCDYRSWQYNLADGDMPNLKQNNVSFNLTHKAGTLDNLTVSIGFFDVGTINIKWTWQNQSAHSRVANGVPKALVDGTPRDQSLNLDTLDKYLEIVNQPNFQIRVKTQLTQQPETVLTIQGMLFHEYLNWIKVEANGEPSDSEESFRGIFGLGERATKNFFYNSGVYSLWAKDTANPVEDGRLPGKNIYGTHPFYIYKHGLKSWVGVYHNNAQAQDWWIKNNYTTGAIGINTIATGGLADIFVFVSSSSPEQIIAKYHNLIGDPVTIPQWALGWNQCRWCYRSSDDVRQSMQGYIDNGIPLDTQWVDIDYMEDYRDFTYEAKDYNGNPGSFAGLPDLIKDIHNRHMKFVPIIDAGVSSRPGQSYQAYNDGVSDDVFIKIAGQNFVGKVWPNEAVYPDFTHPKAQSWWGKQLDQFKGQIAFDGLWQDMNEASNFCDGVCHGDQLVSDPISLKLPYTPTGESLETKAISLDAYHSNGFTQLDAHSLFGSLQVAASSQWFKNKGQRPMIISRSSFAGMGKYGSVWLGDNHALEEDMEISVLGIMNMNIMGIPLAGADICGFIGDTNPQLCARWHSIGQFYPFSRNHHECQGQRQEPWTFKNVKYDDSRSFMDLMKVSIQRKYHLIRYYYTEMMQVSMANNTFYTFYKPMFFEFPEDKEAYNDIANNVMIGEAIKTSVNAKSATQNLTSFYFPAGTWCSLFEPIGQCVSSDKGHWLEMDSHLDKSYAHLRERFIVPMQNATALKAMTTYDLQQAPVDLHILGSFAVPGVMSWTAVGTYLNDDGVTTMQSGNTNQYRFNAQYSQVGGETLTLTISQTEIAANYLDKSTNCSAVNKADYLQSIYVYNAAAFKQHDSLYVSVAYTDDIDNYKVIGTATYDKDTNRIVYDGSVLGNLLCLTRVFRIQFKNLAPVTE